MAVYHIILISCASPWHLVRPPNHKLVGNKMYNSHVKLFYNSAAVRGTKLRGIVVL